MPGPAQLRAGAETGRLGRPSHTGPRPKASWAFSSRISCLSQTSFAASSSFLR